MLAPLLVLCFLSWPDPLVRHSFGKFPEETKSCAIIAAIHELFGLAHETDDRDKMAGGSGEHENMPDTVCMG